MKNDQSLKNSNNNQVAARDIHNYTLTDQNSEEEELGIISDIFTHVIDCNESKDQSASRPDNWIHTSEKIRINFLATDFDEVKMHYKYALTKVSTIKNFFQSLPVNNQDDLHGCFFAIYQNNRQNGLTAIQNLHALFDWVIPNSKKKNPKYRSIGNAIVLLFFEDCSIFEKTEQEKQLALW